MNASKQNHPTRVAYVLAYRAPAYIRSQSLLRALGNCSSIELLVAINRSEGVIRYMETWRALRQIQKHHAPDIYVLGFRGHEIFWPLKWLTRGKPLIFDALMSPSAAMSEESKAGWFGKLIAPLMRYLERGILQNANLVLTDTQQQAAFYQNRFALPSSKVLAIPVGAIESDTTKTTRPEGTPFTILFYGSMLPLHGIDIIISAAAKLMDLPIRFDFVGGSSSQVRHLRNLCASQGVTRYTHRSWVPHDDLVANEIPRASLCLGGPFGDTPQARRVITGKTSQCLALGKATVIGAIHEDTGFLDRHNCLLVPQGDATALAATVRWCYEHRSTLSEIGSRGQLLYREKLSLQTITARLIPALQTIATAPHSEQ